MSHKQKQITTHIVHIISQNFNALHIQSLINSFSRKNIPVQLQSDHNHLGVVLDRRYFVIVDNLSGSVKLGSWFSSLLLYIVGYPKKGKNKKNHYCSTPQQVLAKYSQFCSLPQFLKKNFLSSSVYSKSILKSQISSFSNSKPQSENKSLCQQKPINVSQKNKVHQYSKVFLYLSLRDPKYNKWILKIAANNKKNFSIIQSIQDLCFSTQKIKQSLVLINLPEYRTLRPTDLSNKSLKLIIYASQKSCEQTKASQKSCEQTNAKINIIQVCNSQQQIVVALKKIGFDISAAGRETQKSIIKYNNPFVHQIKSSRTRRIIWDSVYNNNQDSQDKLQQNAVNLNSKTIGTGQNFQQSKNENKCLEISTKQKSSQSLQQSNKYTLIVRSLSTESAPLPTSKRMSIDSNIRRNEILTNNCSEYLYKCNENLKSTQPFPSRRYSNNIEVSQLISKQSSAYRRSQSRNKIQLISAVPLVNQKLVSQQQQSSANLQTHRKICKKLGNQKQRSNSLISQFTSKNQLSSVQRQKQKYSIRKISLSEAKNGSRKQLSQHNKICEQQKQNINHGLSTIGQSLASQKIRNTSILSKVKKQVIGLQQDIEERKKSYTIHTYRNQYQIFNNVQKLYIEQQPSFEKSSAQTESQMSGANLINIELVSKNISECVVLWKDFNFQIQNNKNYVKQEVYNIRDYSRRSPNRALGMNTNQSSFCSPKQFKTLLRKYKQKYLIILIDENELPDYLTYFQQSKSIDNLVAIYVFQKEQKKQRDFISNIRGVIHKKQLSHIRHIIKPVLSHEYYDEGLQAAKQIFLWFTTHSTNQFKTKDSLYSYENNKAEY